MAPVQYRERRETIVRDPRHRRAAQTGACSLAAAGARAIINAGKGIRQWSPWVWGNGGVAIQENAPINLGNVREAVGNKFTWDMVMHRPGFDSLRAWTMVKAPELTREAIVTALRAGHFYASTGPIIRDVA
jgi:hypothetical protein